MKSQEKNSGAAPKATPSRKKGTTTTAIHAQSSDGAEHIVGIGNLRVMLFNDDGSWFAQGLEIDYFSQGNSLEDVKSRFENGLLSTIKLHLQSHGTIDNLLRPAPTEAWLEFYATKPKTRRLTHVSLHELRFDGIEYYEEAA